MSSPARLGEPIPKGFVDRNGVHAATPPDPELDAQLSLLKAELNALRGIISTRMRAVARVAEAHPIFSATAFSLAVWGAILLLHNSLNRNRLKGKIMQRIYEVTASFARHV